MAYTFTDFRAVLRLIDEHHSEMRDFTKAANAAYCETCRLDFKNAFPRRKWSGDPTKAPNHLTIHALHYAARIAAMEEQFYPQQNTLEALRDHIALEAEVEFTPELIQVAVHRANSYRTVGFGCSRYAEAAAERAVEHAVVCGVTAEVRLSGEAERDRYGVNYQDYAVWANVSAEGWELVLLKPGLSLRDWVASCWKRGVNPRVYNPWLPAGIEEKLGVGYQGQILEAKAA